EKDHGAFLTSLLAALEPRSLAQVHCYKVFGRRGAEGVTLAQIAEAHGMSFTVADDVQGAVTTAQAAAQRDDIILVAGSIYTLEDARAATLNAPNSNDSGFVSRVK